MPGLRLKLVRKFFIAHGGNMLIGSLKGNPELLAKVDKVAIETVDQLMWDMGEQTAIQLDDQQLELIYNTIMEQVKIKVDQ